MDYLSKVQTKIQNPEFIEILNKIITNKGYEYEIKKEDLFEIDTIHVRNNNMNHRLTNLEFDSNTNSFTVNTTGTMLKGNEYETFKKETLAIIELVDTLNFTLSL